MKEFENYCLEQWSQTGAIPFSQGHFWPCLRVFLVVTAVSVEWLEARSQPYLAPLVNSASLRESVQPYYLFRFSCDDKHSRVSGSRL